MAAVKQRCQNDSVAQRFAICAVLYFEAQGYYKRTAAIDGTEELNYNCGRGLSGLTHRLL